MQVLRECIAAQDRRGLRFEIVQAFVGREVAEGVTTLDRLPVSDRRNTLIKIDVEGGELDVIAGAQSWMNASNPFIIEVHKAEYLDLLRNMFSERGLTLLQVDQRPLPLLGREKRDLGNWWLVSSLGE